METRAGALISQYEYDTDAVGRRILRLDDPGGAVPGPRVAWTNRFDYNVRGELTNAVRQVGAIGDAWSYEYDAIGNRTLHVSNTLSLAYQANVLNQYTNIAGTALVYDLDGNLVFDGMRTNTWDGENRLVATAPMTPQTGTMRASFIYDYMGRRVRKNPGIYFGVWGTNETHALVYDGWNLLGEYSTMGWTNHYAWGLDLSGTLQGAGGIGGLVSQTRLASGAKQTVYYTYDANGNVGQLLTAADPTNIVAAFEYDPYGNLTQAAGPFAPHARFRFSTKFQDPESGWLYYGYRYYSPYLGRWLNRDPIEEVGGVNCYAFSVNSPDWWDYLGLMAFPPIARTLTGEVETSSSYQTFSGTCGKLIVKVALDADSKPGKNFAYGGETTPRFVGVYVDFMWYPHPKSPCCCKYMHASQLAASAPPAWSPDPVDVHLYSGCIAGMIDYPGVTPGLGIHKPVTYHDYFRSGFWSTSLSGQTTLQAKIDWDYKASRPPFGKWTVQLNMHITLE